MRYRVGIVQVVTDPRALEAGSKPEALDIAEMHLSSVPSEISEVSGNTIPEPPRIRTSRKLRD